MEYLEVLPWSDHRKAWAYGVTEMELIQIRLNAVEEQMLKEVQKRNKVYKDLEALLKQQINAEYLKLI